MTQDSISLPHKLTLNERKQLTLSGVTEVVSFDDETVVLKTSLGVLTVHGQNLQLKNLSFDGGQVAVDGSIHALVYEQTRPDRSGWRRLFQ